MPRAYMPVPFVVARNALSHRVEVTPSLTNLSKVPGMGMFLMFIGNFVVFKEVSQVDLACFCIQLVFGISSLSSHDDHRYSPHRQTK